MRYLVTTDPRAEAQEIEAPCGSAALMEVLRTSHGDRDHVTVYVRPQRPQEWVVFSCVRHGASWSAPFPSYVQVADDEVERLRAELREVREARAHMRDMHDAETMRLRTEILAIGERVREACLTACAEISAEQEASGRPAIAKGAHKCIDAIAAIDLDSLSENAPPR